MKHSASFRRSMLLAYSSVVIFALMLMLVYNITAPNLVAKNKVDDLLPKGQIIAGYIESTLSGEISSGYLVPLIGRSTSQWEATVWVVDTTGETLIRTQVIDDRKVGRLPASLASSMMPAILKGQNATHVGSLEDIAVQTTQSPYSASNPLQFIGDADSTSAEEDLRDKIIAVAVPIFYDKTVVGAVFMAQTMKEVMNSVRVLTNTIMLSIVAVALILLPFIFFIASRMTRPITKMRNVALTMAGGNLNVRADDTGKDEYGELGHALNFLSSELGKTISSLEFERNRLEGFINGLSEGILAFDNDRHLTMINPAVISLLGLPESLDAATADNELKTNASDVTAVFDSVLDTREGAQQTLWRGQIALHISVAPLFDSNGGFNGCVGILSDVTSAERLELTRRDYVANVSHELRTPLTALRALMEPLRDGLVKTEEQRQQIYDVVLRETMRLSRLVNDMLELSRLQSGTASMAVSDFEPQPLFEVIRETYLPYAEDYQKTFIYDVPDHLPPVRGNPDRTQQVLVALLDNAFKYTPDGGTVTLAVEQVPDMLRVFVRDTGIGISEEDQAHVFERFYKADKSHHGQGTGLGLAIAYEIMHLLGETMSVSSVPGEGSCFTFTLHLAPPPETSPALPAGNG
ncbi:MAG: HAMP domain-containing protein [Clostridia bacterium]|nr:HAMP domain-containing protein [Clostridia bacterium]